jgi:ligand-binding SRPBCC domain-containing protein
VSTPLSRPSQFEHVHEVPIEIDQAFAVFSEPANLAQLTPRLLRPHIVEAPPRIAAGQRLRYRIGRLEWVAEIAEWQPPHRFTDVQVRGPYTAWTHTHELVPTSGGTEIRDRVEYRLPGGRLGALLDRLVHRPFLAYLFGYRSRRLDELLTPARR